jgi:hypothetical protein
MSKIIALEIVRVYIEINITVYKSECPTFTQNCLKINCTKTIKLLGHYSKDDSSIQVVKTSASNDAANAVSHKHNLYNDTASLQ